MIYRVSAFYNVSSFVWVVGSGPPHVANLPPTLPGGPFLLLADPLTIQGHLLTVASTKGFHLEVIFSQAHGF
jgi:hypothetical protein